MNDLKKRITNEFTSSSKRQIKNRDKKIAELNTTISEKNEEAIYDQMSEYVKKDEDKLRAQLKKLLITFLGQSQSQLIVVGEPLYIM